MNLPMRTFLGAGLVSVLSLTAGAAPAAELTPEQTGFFDQKVRPILSKCQFVATIVNKN